MSDRVATVVDDEFSGPAGLGHSPSRVTINFDNGDRLEDVVYRVKGCK